MTLSSNYYVSTTGGDMKTEMTGWTDNKWKLEERRVVEWGQGLTIITTGYRIFVDNKENRDAGIPYAGAEDQVKVKITIEEV